jgi:hypothetical protein
LHVGFRTYLLTNVFPYVRTETSRFPFTTTSVDRHPLPQHATAILWTSLTCHCHVRECKRFFSDSISRSLSDRKCVAYRLVVGISNAAASSSCGNMRCRIGSNVPRNFFSGGGSTNSTEDRGQRERESGGSKPLVRGFTQFVNERNPYSD